jgi:hypothetical protein
LGSTPFAPPTPGVLSLAWVDREVLRAVPVREYGAKQPVGLAVDPVSEVEGIGVAVAAADPEIKGPKPAWLVALADIDPDRAAELPGRRVEGVDLFMEKTEVADQQMIDEPAETGGR